MRFIQIPLWPMEIGAIATDEPEKLGAYVDLIRMADHAGMYSPISKEWLEPGELQISDRYLASRWGWSKAKVLDFLNWALELRLFWTKEGTKDGRYLKVCEDGEPPGTLQSEWRFQVAGTAAEAAKAQAEKAETLTQVKFPTHLDTVEVRQALQSFISYRRVVKKKPIKTAGPVDIILNRFKSRSAAVLVAAIEHSMKAEWESVFEPKTAGRKNPNDAHAANLELIAKLRAEESHDQG